MKIHELRKMLAQCDLQLFLEKSQDFITPRRKDLIKQVLASRLQSIQIALEDPFDPHNAAAVVRSCEAMGLTNIHVTHQQDQALFSKGVTQGAFHWISISQFSTIDALHQYLTQHNILLAGACMRADKSLDQVPVDQPICLLFGNESTGLTQSARQACDILYRIPMYGMSESLNLSVSAAISAYDTCKRKRQLLNRTSDLNNEQYQQLQALYYANSVDERLLSQLIQMTQR